MGAVPSKPLIEALATVTNAPLTSKSKGYGFVTLDDDYGGHVVYCPAHVVKSSAISGEDIGTACRVKYVKINSHYVASRITVLRDVATGGDQAIADALVRLDSHVTRICDEMDALYDLLEDRGCAFPEDSVEEDHDSPL